MRSVPYVLSILVLVCLKGLAPAEEARLELFLQTGHTSAVTSVALSDDGKHLVTGSWDKTAILWDTASGKLLQSFQGHPAGVNSVALTGDGKQVVTGFRDGTAILWEAASGKKVQTFQGHTNAV